MCLSFSPFEAQNSLFLLPVQVRSTSRLDETRIKCMQWFSRPNVTASSKKEIFIFIIYFELYIILDFFRTLCSLHILYNNFIIF